MASGITRKAALEPRVVNSVLASPAGRLLVDGLERIRASEVEKLVASSDWLHTNKVQGRISMLDDLISSLQPSTPGKAQ